MTSERFSAEYLSLAETLWQVAWYILEDDAEAEDAVQELYLRLWKMRDALDGIRNPKAYCITLLRNRCLDRLRQRRLVARPETLPEPECPGTQDEQIDVRERLDKVLAAIKSLPASPTRRSPDGPAPTTSPCASCSRRPAANSRN